MHSNHKLGISTSVTASTTNKAQKTAQDMELALRNAGLRITAPRKAILSVLAADVDHPNAMEILQRALEIDPSVALSTVYRTMKVLEEQGAVNRHSFEGGVSRYENAAREHHDHLIDVDTGKLIEFNSPEIEELQERIARELGYEIVDHKLELYVRKIKR